MVLKNNRLLELYVPNRVKSSPLCRRDNPTNFQYENLTWTTIRFVWISCLYHCIRNLNKKKDCPPKFGRLFTYRVTIEESYSFPLAVLSPAHLSICPSKYWGSVFWCYFFYLFKKQLFCLHLEVFVEFSGFQNLFFIKGTDDVCFVFVVKIEKIITRSMYV